LLTPTKVKFIHFYKVLYSIVLHKFILSSASVVYDKILYGALRSFGSTSGAAEFPVWCPDNSPVDGSLFTDILPPAAEQTVVLYVDASHPAILPKLTIGDSTTGWDFICEDV